MPSGSQTMPSRPRPAPAVWFSRSTACINAEGRVSQAINRVQSLTFGARRPSFVPVADRLQAWEELRARLNEASRRASAACSSIKPSR